MKAGRPRKTPPAYPAIDEAIKAKGGVMKYCEERYISTTAYYQMQNGKTMPLLDTIMELLDYTGLTFEQAFLNKPAPEPEPELLREKNIPPRAATQDGKEHKH